MAARERKLLPHEKVEVRSLEDGFLGSWHPGVVISCEKLVRVVKYDHLLRDDGSAKLVEEVKVTNAIDGVLDQELRRPDEYRGLIRPSRTSCVLGEWNLPYGKCVDLFHEDAWWEGVVFDHEDGCERRRIFFPDIGDEMEARVGDLRLSKEWDEVTEEWKGRGNWMFLELIEELEQEWPLLVSVKQMWYEVRMKNDFEKVREWTSSQQDLWKELLLQVLHDNLKVAVEMLFADVNSSCKSAKSGKTLLKFSEEAFDSLLKSEVFFRSSRAVVPFKPAFQSGEGILQTDVNDKSNIQVQKQDDQIPTSVRHTNEQPPSISSPDLPTNIQTNNEQDEDSDIDSDSDESRRTSLIRPREKPKKSTKKGGLEWLSAVPEMISGPENCPNAIEACNKLYRLKKVPPKALKLAASKHLLHLGWEIEFSRTKFLRQRYYSPEGNLHYSFHKVCMMFDHDFESGPGSQVVMRQNNDIGNSDSLPEETLSPPPGKSQASSELSKLCTPDEKHDIEPEYCPEALKDYCLFRSRKSNRGGSSKKGNLKIMKAKKHLSAIGWSFYYHQKKHKRELRYYSPSGERFFSLASACEWCIRTAAHTSTDLSTAMGKVINTEPINDGDDDLSTSKSPLPLFAMGSTGNLLPSVENDVFGKTQLPDMPASEGFVHTIRISRKRKKHESDCIEVSPSPKRGRKSGVSVRLRGDSNTKSSTPVRRSSKRVRDKVASSTQQTPRTILSWLIDNNVVLPRAKVEYRSSKNGLEMEGRISREGIKCSCCGKIFSLSKFEAHAGSSDHRPSANIFLEDGRSLLDCQLQLKRRNNGNPRLERQLKGTQHNKKSDNICSVCHYGGELVLCDRCPSSFHIQCLGLKDVPDGDWFCPSCCCQICNKSRFNTGNRLANDSSLRTCRQCERRYHAECLTSEEDTNGYPEDDWFCQNTCRQIFYGLRRILGKKIPVGIENLSWTLVKYLEPDSSKHEESDDEVLVESYSKLSVALQVMHECFEPVKEPRTKRDLMEDVIFNRWSELNRLNFKGFYTIILEKNDELISAANVRIYGKTVAEVPLVATRFQYRRLGMCRILMNELEKKLTELGVERLVLPAIPSVLNTWINSFGFSKMDASERLNFLVYTFLDFQGTVFCQKLLKIDLSVILRPAETQSNCYDHLTNTVDIGDDRNSNSAVSELSEGKHAEETDIVERESTSIKTVADNVNAGCSCEKAIVVVDQPTLLDCSTFKTLDYLSLRSTCNDKQSGNNTEGAVICYKRRKVSTC